MAEKPFLVRDGYASNDELAAYDQLMHIETLANSNLRHDFPSLIFSDTAGLPLDIAARRYRAGGMFFDVRADDKRTKGESALPEARYEFASINSASIRSWG